MAIAQSDGSIILSVEIDTSGITKGFSSIRSAISTTSGGFQQLGKYITTALSIKTIMDFSREAGEMATQQESDVLRLIDIYGEASKAVGDYIDANAQAIGMSRSAAAQFAAVYGNLFSVWADQRTNAELTQQYLNMTAVVASKTGRTVEDVQERVRSGLLGNTEAIEDLGVFVNVKTIEMTDAFKRMANGKSWEQLDAYTQQQIRTMAILEQATQKYGKEVANTTALTRAKYDAAFQDFKATWGQVVNTVLIPILEIATQIFDTLTVGLRSLAGLSGTTIDSEELEKQKASIGGSAENQKKLTDEVKNTNKELKKAIAGFDDLMILTDTSTSGASGNTPETSGASGNTPETSGNEGFDGGKYTEKLTALGMVAGAALVGLGVILLFSGHPLVGIAMVASGYVLGEGAATGGKDDLGEEEKEKLATIGTVTGAALLGLGILLLFTSFTTLGLGMIASGAMALYESKELGEFSEDIKTKITNILVIAGTVMLILGCILLFVPGTTMLGVAMLAAGAGELVAAAAANFEEVKKYLNDNFGQILVEIGRFMFMIGVILLFIPSMQGIALGAMVAGVAIMAIGAVTPDFNTLKKTIVDFFEQNKENIFAASAGMLVLGIILCFLPGTTGIGLALLAAGAGGLIISAFNMDGSEIIEGIKKFCNMIIGLFESFLNFITGGIRTLANSLFGLINDVGAIIGIDFDLQPLPEIKLPRLAQGAVIPPNREFLAVLGDQKRGVNIEAPLDTIVEAVKIALANFDGGNSGNTTVVLEIDGREFGNAVITQGQREAKRLGTRLVMA